MQCQYKLLSRCIHPDQRSTQQNQANSPLLQLPAELRNRIYYFIFDAATLKRDLSPTSAQHYRVVLNSSHLLRVCRQTRFEAAPLQTGFTYHQLNIRMDNKHIPDLVKWVGQAQCAQIVRIEMFLSLANAIHRMVRRASVPGRYTGPWAASGDRIFPSLSSVVVTYPFYLEDDEGVRIRTALRTLFGNPDLHVHFRAATYW